MSDELVLAIIERASGITLPHSWPRKVMSDSGRLIFPRLTWGQLGQLVTVMQKTARSNRRFHISMHHNTLAVRVMQYRYHRRRRVEILALAQLNPGDSQHFQVSLQLIE